MTQEDIEEAADKYTDELFKKENDFYVRDCLGIIAPDAFIYGANWRINSVWHDMSEEPKKEEMLLLHGNGRTISILWNGDIKWKGIGKFFRAEKWAYMKDLLPSKED